jgi:uncharacterized protein
MNHQIPYIPRLLPIETLVEKKSYFLFGPRQTGKTSIITARMQNTRIYDLLDTTTYLNLSQHPGRIEEELETGDRIIVIDEIQRLPDLLHEVHKLIEKRKIKFLLTGSSARKLRRGGINLLGGRARIKHLYPFTRKELGGQFDLERALTAGLLPSIYFSDDPSADLRAYMGTYLQQEVVAEGATRNVPAFSRFLRVAAHCNGAVVNFTGVANDAQVPRTTVYEYFEILKDTLIIHELPAWKKTTKRKPLVSSKYYFFDVGVVAALQGRRFVPGTTEYGEALETYIAHELRAYSGYVSGERISFWRSESGYEVDFIIADHTAIEVKAKRTISSQDVKALSALAEETKLRNYLCVCLETRRRTLGNIHILPYQYFLDRLWEGEFGKG